jgi:uncharacterized membrane-anchored protein YhcB (DUF1043 family)
MSLWLVLLLGVIAGILIGIISGRSTYTDCRELIKELEQEVHDKEQKLDEAQTEIDHLKHQQEEITQQAPPGDESSAAPTND